MEVNVIEQYLHNNELIVCPNNLKEEILKYLNSHKLIYSIKFMTLDEYKKNYLFDYNFDTLYYLVRNYNLTIDNAKNILNNLYYIDSNKKYDNYKLDELVNIKNDLDNNNLLKYNELFKKNLKKYNIFIYGYNLDKLAIPIIFEQILYCESITPFGLDVVPDVNNNALIFLLSISKNFAR